MMPDDDAAKLHEISRGLPAIDLDATAAERIARRARADVGKGLPKRRLLLPLVTALVAASYAAWVIAKLVEILR